jgi:hypothetical protein
MADRWMIRSRNASQPSFNRRMAEATTIAEIKTLITESTTAKPPL